AGGSGGGDVAQHITEYGPVRKAQDVIEITEGIDGVAASVGPAEDGNSPLSAAEVAQGIGGLCGLGKGGDEDQVGGDRRCLQQVSRAGVTEIGDLMPFLGAPGGDGLGHDAGQGCPPDAPEKPPPWASGQEVD